MQEKFGKQGLTVLGLTSESVKLTEPWIKSKGVKYGYAYDKGGKLQSWFGVDGIPHAVLLDPSGTIVWRGHPAGLEESSLETALAGSLKTPLWEWPKSAKTVRQAVVKGQLAKALEYAQGLPSGDVESVTAAVRGIIDGRMAAMKAAQTKKDYLTALDSATELGTALKGLPEATEAAGIADAINADAEAQRVIKGQKTIRKLAAQMGELRKRKEAEKMIDKLKDLLPEYAGTYAYEEAAKLIDDLRSKMPSLQ